MKDPMKEPSYTVGQYIALIIGAVLLLPIYLVVFAFKSKGHGRRKKIVASVVALIAITFATIMDLAESWQYGSFELELIHEIKASQEIGEIGEIQTIFEEDSVLYFSIKISDKLYTIIPLIESIESNEFKKGDQVVIFQKEGEQYYVSHLGQD